jgi:hypothetical protein
LGWRNQFTIGTGGSTEAFDMMAPMPRPFALCALAAIACSATWASAANESAAARERIGACTVTTVTYVGWRAGESGSVIEYANGLWQVDYNIIAGIHNSRRGDRVRLCLAEIPKDCPHGDERGRTYEATNLRTRESWSAINSEHSCGGA